MSFLASALELAQYGFHVFPLIANSKLPAIEDFPNRATRDPEQIRKWWIDPVLELEQPFNVGISTTRFGDNEGLVVVDVDNKDGKNGDEGILSLEFEGFSFPETFEQSTPTGGRHLVYRNKEAIRQGTSVLAKGLDIRSKGGYVVGAGSSLDGERYTAKTIKIAECPGWIVDKIGTGIQKTSPRTDTSSESFGIAIERAEKRAIQYLESAPRAIEGDNGDHTTFKVASRLKDLGIPDVENCFRLLCEYWNPTCSPPWDPDELYAKVENAYRYGSNPVGIDAPEKQFEPVEIVEAEKPLHPFEKINREFAFVLAGGGHHILWETTDAKGRYKLEHLNEITFHKKFAAENMDVGDGKFKPVTELWMRDKTRRSYDGICFRPGRDDIPKNWYNLWRGFAVKPQTPSMPVTKPAANSVTAFLDHTRDNICGGQEWLFKWLIGYFAHLIQRPWEKPLVALVFRGQKGVGKNAMLDRIGYLLGQHYLLSSNKRYLTSNFNGHLENCLLFVLDEAFWSGDKQAEGVLKDLITGQSHVIEHKGKEPYTVENCTRVCILGNEEWLVPATQDERRFAVFDVGDARKQDRTFFKNMREGMEAGGYSILLRYLMEYDLSKIDVNEAPKTDALLDQKISSLEPFHQWWHDCLTEGRLVGGDFGSGWIEEVERERFRSAFRRYVKDRQIKSRIPDDRTIGKALRGCLPKADLNVRKREGEETLSFYKLSSIGDARAAWEKYTGHSENWPK